MDRSQTHTKLFWDRFKAWMKKGFHPLFHESDLGPLFHTLFYLFSTSMASFGVEICGPTGQQLPIFATS